MNMVVVEVGDTFGEAFELSLPRRGVPAALPRDDDGRRLLNRIVMSKYYRRTLSSTTLKETIMNRNVSSFLCEAHDA
jgi:hypothetical protein